MLHLTADHPDFQTIYAMRLGAAAAAENRRAQERDRVGINNCRPTGGKGPGYLAILAALTHEFQTSREVQDATKRGRTVVNGHLSRMIEDGVVEFEDSHREANGGRTRRYRRVSTDD